MFTKYFLISASVKEAQAFLMRLERGQISWVVLQAPLECYPYIFYG